ncbi:MAG: glycosyltransferase family 2 protein [Eubacteriales bacterium]|nr:glycosyltransferase family 2 protein [Eubacteriales bacterium]
MEKKVSVIIPSYNRAEVLEKSIHSVLNQSYQNLECILVDDGSTDNTRTIAKSISDPRLRYVYQENAGACAARNHGIALAEGKYIAFHDSDDVWHKEKLEKQIDTLEKNKVDLVICKLIHIHEDDTIRLTPKYIREGNVSIQDDFFGVGTQTIVARKEIFEQEMFDEKMPRLQDFEWLYRVLKSYHVYCMSEGLVDYRVGEDSISRNHEKRFLAEKLFLKKHPEVRCKTPVLSAHLMKDLLKSWQVVRKQTPKKSRNYLRLALQYYPGVIRFVVAKIKK